jgi:hypothetical protein
MYVQKFNSTLPFGPLDTSKDVASNAISQKTKCMFISMYFPT